MFSQAVESTFKPAEISCFECSYEPRDRRGRLGGQKAMASLLLWQRPHRRVALTEDNFARNRPDQVPQVSSQIDE